MSIPKNPDPAKLIISLFMNSKDIFESALFELKRLFGEVDMVSSWFNFDYTDYYYAEMGHPLFRKVVAFKELINQSDLAQIKENTNLLEKKWTADNTIDEVRNKTDEHIKDGSTALVSTALNLNRSLNIDPGYLLLSRFILATG
ncbi:MAG: DUF4416 family protein, partial [Desulfamplus sp.]|nr:DUF4416 family protein [Desulfamplus sp.]